MSRSGSRRPSTSTSPSNAARSCSGGCTDGLRDRGHRRVGGRARGGLAAARAAAPRAQPAGRDRAASRAGAARRRPGGHLAAGHPAAGGGRRGQGADRARPRLHCAGGLPPADRVARDVRAVDRPARAVGPPVDRRAVRERGGDLRRRGHRRHPQRRQRRRQPGAEGDPLARRLRAGPGSADGGDGGDAPGGDRRHPGQPRAAAARPRPHRRRPRLRRRHGVPAVSQVSILIVDDYPENLLALEAILAPTGHHVIRANSGREALKALLTQDVALVLMDVAMPDLDGYETAALIRGRERSRLTPIIFLTANHKADAHVFKGYSVGAVDYLFKPFVPEVLLSKVAIFVELYNSRQVLKTQADALHLAYGEMEQRVLERTSELATANRALLAEIVERRRAEDERALLFEREQAARLEAESMNRMKDEFLGTLSHELRTPLNAILGWTHLLEIGKRDEASIARAARVIKSNAQAQAQLVADILDVSRIISGKLSLYIAPVDLRAVIESTLETLQPAADAKGISIETAWTAAGDTLLADQDRLRQVMWNLLSNAIKFTPAGGHA